MIKCKIQSIFLALHYVLYQQFSYFLTPANFKDCNQSSSSETLQDYFIQVNILLENAIEKIVKKYIIQHCAVTLLTKKTTSALYLIRATFFTAHFLVQIFSLQKLFRSTCNESKYKYVVGQVKIRKKHIQRFYLLHSNRIIWDKTSSLCARQI